MKIIVTGGAGFIGSSVIRHIIRQTDANIVNLDKLTYAATPEALEDCPLSSRYKFLKIDICDLGNVRSAIHSEQPDAIMHLAAESHVDRSIEGPDAFIQTNVFGTFNLLKASKEYYETLTKRRRTIFRFHHVSTDEVYGTLSLDEPAFTEETPYRPNSPYSASKAASDHLVRAWAETYGLPVVCSNCSNNYGLWQFPEKLIPVIITKALDEDRLPVYGSGTNIRDWLHVTDHARALWLILSKGKIGERYNVGGNEERTNLNVVETICAIMDSRFPEREPHCRLIEFVADRPGHDLRYAIDASKIRKELQFNPSYSFEAGVAETIDWYINHQEWWRRLLEEGDIGRRIGLQYGLNNSVREVPL